MNKTAIPTTVEDLRAQWPSLHDLDKAISIKKILKDGTKIRSLATMLGVCTEANLRNLLKALKAPAPDRLLAREGKISTRELIRRSKLAAEEQVERTRAEENLQRAKETKKWSTTICRWLQEQPLAWAHQVNIIQETMREFMEADLSGTLPKINVPNGVTLEMIIDRTRPRESNWEQALDIYTYISWLAHWTLLAIPDPLVRDAALADALERTHLYESVPTRKP